MIRFPFLSAFRVGRFAFFLTIWTVYVTSFWGHFRGRRPECITEKTGAAKQLVWNLYTGFVEVGEHRYTHHIMVWLAVSYVLGAFVPLALMRLMGRGYGEIGLSLPNRWGRRVALVCVVASVPFALLIAWEQPTVAEAARWSFSRSPAYKLALFASTIPEHLLLTGICVAFFLPGFRLPRPPELAPVEGPAIRRGLRWLGLAQPTGGNDPWTRRLWTWMGLQAGAPLALAAGGILFGIVHVGARPIEFATSFPGGMAICYVTYRSRSIWPGWIAHVSMMLLIQLLMIIMGRV